MTLNALTIDVEEYFHAENLRSAYPRDSWEELESRLDEPMEKLRALLARKGVRATFFVLGWVAERRPWIVQRLAQDGHEIASHGYGHELLTKLEPAQLREDVRRANRILLLLSGKRPRGYRAPCFTVVPGTRWALPLLAEEGFEYDSSVFPIRHDRYGDPDAPVRPHRLDLGDGRTIAEAPPATFSAFGRNFPIAGGGYLRLFPWWANAAAIDARNAEDIPAVVYLHPWELDPRQPRHKGVPLLKRVRHSIGTGGVLRKLERLLDSFRFGALENVLERHGLLEPARSTPTGARSRPAAEGAAGGGAA
jgi:polysaccharide deacetylase family protein (PEP-CTERM system associated)